MKTLFTISFRNLIRQKRRNLLLGIGIALGMAILVVSNAFSQGILDILLNKFVVWLAGHVKVTMMEKDEREWNIIRDKGRIEQIIREAIPADIAIFEDVSSGGRGISGSGVATMFLKGVALDEGFFLNLRTGSGDVKDLSNPNIENPIMLSSSQAQTLKVKVNDTIQVGFQTVYGQMESAKFTVVAILRDSIPLVDRAAYTHLNTLKPLLGYKEHETRALNITIKNLKNAKMAKQYADRLHQALQPGIAGYNGLLNGQSARFFAVAEEQAAQFASQVNVTAGSIDEIMADASAIMISRTLADTLGVTVGNEITSTYQTRFEGTSPITRYRVGAIFQADGAIAKDMAFVAEQAFLTTFFAMPPKSPAPLDRSHALAPVLAKEWMLLERTADSKDLQKKYDELAYSDWRGKTADVQTMFEVASGVLNLALVFDLMILAAVLVLFFIILIGVVNTLHMTIRERTREIGTLRAIGMQQAGVRWSFMAEVLLLTMISCVAGLVVGLLVIQVLSMISVEGKGALVILLVDNHLHFVPTLGDVVKNFLIIIAITLITAYFPAQRAAKLSVAESLRHYE